MTMLSVKLPQLKKITNKKLPNGSPKNCQVSPTKKKTPEWVSKKIASSKN
jgi:hypothetical protein